MSDAEPGELVANEETLRDSLSRANLDLAKIGPILSHLLATPDQSMFSDEIIARIRGMCHSLAWQILRAQADAAGQSGRDAFAERHGERFAEHLFKNPLLVSHCHALALEWQSAEKLEIQYGIDPVLSPLIQQLIASKESAVASSAMSALTAQARFVQTQRRMELPLSELPGDLFHDLLIGWRAFTGQVRSDAMIRAEAKLRNQFDESISRLALLARCVAGMGAESTQALDIDQAGIGLFLTALAARSGQTRLVTVLSTNYRQTARLVLALRAAGLSSSEAERQVLRIHPEAVPPRDIGGLSEESARRILSESLLQGANST